MSRPNSSFNFFTHYRDMISRYAVQDRFHLGALVWHDNVMSKTRLRLIESWLAEVGSVVIVLIASDEKWYEDHLEKQPKEEMFSRGRIRAGNREFAELIATDYARADFVHDVSKDGFLTDRHLNTYLDEWYGRLFQVERAEKYDPLIGVPNTRGGNG
jgi:hypothetical protein